MKRHGPSNTSGKNLTQRPNEFLNEIATSVSVKKKGGKTDRKPYPLPYGLRNPYRNLNSENSLDYAPTNSLNVIVRS